MAAQGHSPANRQPVHVVAGKNAAAHSTGDVAPAMEDRVVAGTARFAGVAANIETNGPVLSTHEIGPESGRRAAARDRPDKIAVIADAHQGHDAREIVATAWISGAIESATAQLEIPFVAEWLGHCGPVILHHGTGL